MNMRRIITGLLVIALLTACSGYFERTPVNLDKPSSKGIDLKKYCDRIELLPMDKVQGLPPDSKFCVYDKGFIIQKDSVGLACFDENGHFQQELKFDEIVDFSTYRNQRLYVLTPGSIEMYDLKDLSYEGSLPLPESSYTYCKVGGMDEDLVTFMAIRDGRDYSGEYDFEEQKFYFSNSGDIFRMEDFYFLSHQWDFKHKEPLNICVSNVQMFSRKLYMQIETDRGDYCLITTLDEKDYPRSTKLFLNSNTPCSQMKTKNTPEVLSTAFQGC